MVVADLALVEALKQERLAVFAELDGLRSGVARRGWQFTPDEVTRLAFLRCEVESLTADIRRAERPSRKQRRDAEKVGPGRSISAALTEEAY